MPGLPANLAFRTRRMGYLFSRGLLSLRTRGIWPTLQRVLLELARARADAIDGLVLADPDESGLPRFDPVEHPQASIVVPVYGQFAMTRDCLNALARQAGDASMEVIVVDDASCDETPEQLRDLPGLRYHRMATNSGFIDACNAGASLASGRFLVFLNNDTIVQPGWLDSLLSTFTHYPDTGLAGARLVYPDGLLQEAGGIVFNDGTAYNHGRFESPEEPRFGFVREVDYCTGAAIAIPAALFRDLGGFDTHFSPAYYEDTDLAMRVRQAGLKVRYQPHSVVVHREGATAGTDENSGAKAYQRINRRKFRERWQARLAADHPAPDMHPVLAGQHRCKLRILVIDVQVPHPDRDSGSLRMVNLLRILGELGHAVSFLPESRDRDGPYGLALEQLGVELWSRRWLGSVPSWFARHGHRFDVVIASRHYIASAYAPLVRSLAPRARLVFDTVDLHFLREQREAELGGLARRQADRTRELELGMIHAADASLVVSTHEHDLLAELAPEARVAVVSNVHEVPGCRRDFNARRDLVFVGGFRHPPNVDAVTWLVEDIWPLLVQRLPGVQLHVIGGDVPAGIQALGRVDGVTVHGFVPDLDPFMDGCRLALAPLRYGAGVKGKVNLSMAHGQPVVATSCGAEGMHLEHGVDVLVADTPAAFADAVVAAYSDPVLWARLSSGGIDNVSRHFSFDAARRTLGALLDELVPAAARRA